MGQHYGKCTHEARSHPDRPEWGGQAGRKVPKKRRAGKPSRIRESLESQATRQDPTKTRTHAGPKPLPRPPPTGAPRSSRAVFEPQQGYEGPSRGYPSQAGVPSRRSTRTAHGGVPVRPGLPLPTQGVPGPVSGFPSGPGLTAGIRLSTGNGYRVRRRGTALSDNQGFRAASG